MEAYTVQDIARHCGVEEAWLEGEVPRKRFHEVSRYMVAWRRLAPLLNLTEADVNDIEENSKRAERKRESFLEKWQQKSMKATYRALMEALLKIERVQDAVDVCRLLAGSH